jgi:hypothetical protein
MEKFTSASTVFLEKVMVVSGASAGEWLGIN